MAEGVGFEPTEPYFRLDSLAKSWLRPLTQPSVFNLNNRASSGLHKLPGLLNQFHQCTQQLQTSQYQ